LHLGSHTKIFDLSPGAYTLFQEGIVIPIEPVEAYVLASLVVGLKISEIVDRPNWIASSYLPHAIVG
jgi:acetamidase/formamidase